MRLVLIRHAEPQAALDGLVAGPRGCTGLSDLGRRQAAALAQRLECHPEFGPAVVLTSVLRRAQETATTLQPVIGPATQDCDLCELHPGSCDGERWVEHGARYPSADWPDRPFSE